jgi:hypothetical protein
MSDLEALKERILKEAEENFGQALNRNAVEKGIELIGSFGTPGKAIESLVKLFMGREEVKDKEVWKVERKIILEFLLQISSSLENLNTQLSETTTTRDVVFGGLVLVEAKDVTNLVGMEVKKSTKFLPGSSINVKAENVENITGVKIG